VSPENNFSGDLWIFRMANFYEAFFKTLEKVNGGYSKKDNNEKYEIYKNISRIEYPDWKGWSILDSERLGSINRETMNFYKNTFWDHIENVDNILQEQANQLMENLII